MSMLTLKIIAVISMLLDQIGYAADIYALRCVGRLAVPIFAFLEGVYKTGKDTILKYIDIIGKHKYAVYQRGLISNAT